MFKKLAKRLKNVEEWKKFTEMAKMLNNVEEYKMRNV